MIEFAKLVDQLYFTSSNNAKAELIKQYLRNTPDPDRGWAIAAISGDLSFTFFKRKLIKDLITERVDPTLFDLSYDYVGEMSETVAHLWHPVESDPAPIEKIPSLNEVIQTFQQAKRAEAKDYLISLLNSLDASQRWALLKLGTAGLRIGVSARFIKKILAEYGQESGQSEANIEEVEHLWHGIKPPYTEFFTWLESKSEKPDVSESITFQPVMLSHPLEQADLDKMQDGDFASDYAVEYKFDGIRVQLVVNAKGKALFSRTGDDISHSFPDLMESLEDQPISGVFDGELIAVEPSEQESEVQGGTEIVTGTSGSHRLKIASFNQLQQRLNKKKPSKKLMAEYPVGIILYDCLQHNGDSQRNLSFVQRREVLSKIFNQLNASSLFLSNLVDCPNTKVLEEIRSNVSSLEQNYIEGIMLKRKDSVYQSGRPKGMWYKWKRDPLLIDAVMMYAQRGHGKRSSFYSDYTFGCWQDDQLLPVGKAYSGFTDEELKQIDRWIRNNTIGRFGPVKEVKKELVFELAFDSVHNSNRHKSGIALRFPRVHRIRWDKPSNEADTLDTLKSMID